MAEEPKPSTSPAQAGDERTAPHGETAAQVETPPRPEAVETSPRPEAVESPASPRRAPKDVPLDFLAPPDERGGLGRLGPYRVLEVLGVGGMGIVLKAEDPTLRRTVALKVMLPWIAQEIAPRERFLREARTAAAIDHDYVMPIYHVGEEHGVPFFAMPYVEGMTLEQWLQRGHRPTVRQTLRVGREAALGLAAAHAKGLIHRDIKPANVWLDASRGGRVKILDFGLARQADDETRITQFGMVLGTPSYMSPEQVRGEAIDARSDLFSLGCLLYRLTTGRRPFRGKDSMAVLMALMNESPPPVTELNPEVPPALADLIHRLLEKDPARRPASAREVAQAVEAVRQGSTDDGPVMMLTPAQPPPAPPDPAPPDQVPRPTYRAPLTVGAVLMVLVLVCGFAGLAGGLLAVYYAASGPPAGNPAAAAKATKKIILDGKSGIPILLGADLTFRHNGRLLRSDPKSKDNPHKAYEVVFERDKTYEISLHSDLFDPYLFIYANGWMKGESKGTSGVRDAQIVYTATETGVHRIFVSHTGAAAAGDPGAYTLTVRDTGGP
jgi:serine/threonine protein kinase